MRAEIAKRVGLGRPKKPEQRRAKATAPAKRAR
jgi:hypothetical protein